MRGKERLMKNMFGVLNRSQYYYYKVILKSRKTFIFFFKLQPENRCFVKTEITGRNIEKMLTVEYKLLLKYGFMTVFSMNTYLCIEPRSFFVGRLVIVSFY